MVFYMEPLWFRGAETMLYACFWYTFTCFYITFWNFEIKKNPGPYRILGVWIGVVVRRCGKTISQSRVRPSHTQQVVNGRYRRPLYILHCFGSCRTAVFLPSTFQVSSGRGLFGSASWAFHSMWSCIVLSNSCLILFRRSAISLFTSVCHCGMQYLQ